MNIKEAKEEIKHTLLAYNRKDAAGRYTFPRLRQRPILLMGPPGIGKTANFRAPRVRVPAPLPPQAAC